MTWRYTSPMPPPPDATGLPTAQVELDRNISRSAGLTTVPRVLPRRTSIVVPATSPPARPVIVTLDDTVVGMQLMTTRPTRAYLSKRRLSGSAAWTAETICERAHESVPARDSGSVVPTHGKDDGREEEEGRDVADKVQAPVERAQVLREGSRVSSAPCAACGLGERVDEGQDEIREGREGTWRR